MMMTSSLRGLGRVSKSRDWIWRILWVITFICVTILSMYFVGQILKTYYKYDAFMQSELLPHNK